MDSLPHRVIYMAIGKFTTRVFGNYEQAKKFAEDKKNVTIQLASEIPNIKPATNHLNRREALRNPCKCGKHNKLKSEELCYICSGAFVRIPVETQ